MMTPNAASVPANIPGFAFTATNATASDIHLVVAGTTTELPVKTGPIVDNLLEVSPASQLVPGTKYKMTWSPFCTYGGYAIMPLSFVAADPAPLPTKYGDAKSPPVFTLHPNLRPGDEGAFDLLSIQDYVPAMLPWRDLYKVTLVLDGQELATTQGVSIGAPENEINLYASSYCTDALAATTKHTVQVVAKLPFAPTLNGPVMPLDFACPAPNHTTPTNPNLPPGATPDGIAYDNTNRSSGCVVAAGSTSPSWFAAVGLAIGAVLVLRRRSQE
jgi:MYXO-CTERM domain-containing protein